MQGDPLSGSSEPRDAGPPAGFQSRSAAYESRAALFRKQLAADKIALSELRALAYDGIPEEKGLRALVWKASASLPAGRGRSSSGHNLRECALIAALPTCPLQLLLGYLPLERSQWPKFLQRKRAEYAHFCEVGEPPGQPGLG
jgi:hypothetical protein